MKPVLAFCFCMLTIVAAVSQTTRIDSFKNLYNKSTVDTTRVNLLNSITGEFTEVNLDSARAIGNRSLELAKKIGYRKGEAKAYVRLAYIYSYRGEWDSARRSLEMASEVTMELSDSTALVSLYSTYGGVYGMNAKYDSSIYFTQKAVAIAEAQKDNKALSSAYQNIAASYHMLSNFPQALIYMQKGLKLAEEAKDLNTQSYLQLNMGMAHTANNDLTKAELAFLKAVNLGKAVEAKNVELYAYSNLCSIYDRQQNFKMAHKYAVKGIDLAKEMGDVGMQATNHSWAALALLQENNLKEAESFATRALVLADSSHQPLNIYQANSALGMVYKGLGKYKESIRSFEKGFSTLKEAGADIFDAQIGKSYHELSGAYELAGDYKKALEMAVKAREISDSITSRENIRRSTELDLKYQFAKEQEGQKADQEKKDAVSHAQKVTLGIGLALTIMLAAFAFYAYRNKSRTNAQLQSQKEEIENTLAELKAVQAQLIQSEKMASLGELTAGIAHEIQNPLNFVNNFSDLNTELVAEMKVAIDKGDLDEVKLLANDISSNGEKISHHGKRADGIVKGMLQHSRTSNGVKEPTDINALADEYLRLAYHGLRAKDKSFNASMNTNFDQNIGKIKVIPQDIGRVILNLITNAFYAVTEKKKADISDSTFDPSVTVTTRRVNNKVEIKVRDNGNGIPDKIIDKIFQPFFTTKPTGQGTGLGLSLSYDIVTKGHGGEFKVESIEGEYTEFTVSLPI